MEALKEKVTLNEEYVLNYYLSELKKDNIDYLKGRPKYKDEIAEYIVNLRDSKNMNEKISHAKKLWKVLFEASMTYIDKDKRGYDKLFKFFDEYVEFEELIFASDSFYRDHTLHCLWVYFLGEYICREKQFNDLIKDRNQGTKQMKDMYYAVKALDNKAFDSLLAILENGIEIFKYDDSIRCVSALTHDLGYPLKKIEKINKAIRNVLPYFAIDDYDEFNFEYSNVDQKYIGEFLDFLSTTIAFSSSMDESDEAVELLEKVFIRDGNNLVGAKKDELLKLSDKEIEILKGVFIFKLRMLKNKALSLAYNNDFKDYKHGIMSAFLLIKNLKSFNGIRLNEGNDMDFEDVNFADVLAKQEILRAVSDHTSSGYSISSITSPSSFLTLVDELEEFSRISRANQNREYVEQFCSTNIYMNDNWLNIEFVFDNTEIDNLDLERAFKGRCERFLSLFNIPKLSENLKIRLKCIGNLPYNHNTYTLELARKYAKITINDEEKDIPSYLKSKEFYSREEYQNN